ncbi:MAG: dephospho-CoA kinase [Candidatus Limnocylindrales bacterium]
MTPSPPGRRALRIGLTGPIGCGKSTVASWLARQGALVIDADAVAREVTDRPAVQAAILDAFGPDAAGPTGTLDRQRLAGIVFRDPDALRRLEALTHPLVRERIEAALRAAEDSRAPAVAIEAIKLVEGGLADECDEVWLVTCEPATQRARLEARGMAADDAARRIAAQGAIRDAFAARATRVLITDGAPAAVASAVLAAYAAALTDGRHVREG